MKKLIFLFLIALFSCKSLPESKDMMEDGQDSEEKTKKEMIKGVDEKKQSNRRMK
ncbi:hypothetical protein [Borrelia turcica]|uniref:hypothetical protein n=1 Tax=Borrelia turcica TaxID=229155 RepID=UPI0013750CE3|nr:hypothetical protein [Borrelia turcica]